MYKKQISDKSKYIPWLYISKRSYYKFFTKEAAVRKEPNTDSLKNILKNNNNEECTIEACQIFIYF